MSHFRRGLVVGKFSPLHRGHELVVGRALAACDEVLVLSYASPERPGCEPEKRARWMSARFGPARTQVITSAWLAPHGERLPPDDAPDDVHRRFVAWVCQSVMGLTIDAVFTSEDYGPGFARVLAERFGHPVAHVAVDPDRRAVPISASVIRENVHQARTWLDPEVYCDFVERVGLIGGESSGKTTLAAALAERLGTVWVPEYGRELWEARAGQLQACDMLEIAKTQLAREDAARRQASRWVFCDSTPLVTLFYARALFGHAVPALERLADTPYDRIVLCAPDFPFVQDGTRQDEKFRERQHAFYVGELHRRGIRVIHATGEVETRIRDVASDLHGHR